MPLYLKIALRYLTSKKSTNSINIISWICIGAMALGIMFMLLIMSVFNGFQGLVIDMFNVFYADVKLFPDKGKYVTLSAEELAKIKSIDGVELMSTILEEDALLEYKDKQFVATVKGVESNYFDIIDLEEKYIINGVLKLEDTDKSYAIVGAGIKNALRIDVNNPFTPMKVSIPRKNARQTSFESAFNFDFINPVGEFNVQQEFDEKYVLVPQEFVRNIRGGENEYSSIEIKLSEKSKSSAVIKEIQALFPNLDIQNRWQQNATLYKVMETEKWVVFALLTLAIIIISFSIAGVLSMLILDKKKDIAVLLSLGAKPGLIKRIFLAEGVIFSIIGFIIGSFLMLSIYQIQTQHGIVKMPGNTFVVQHFPLQIKFIDFLAAFIVIFLIGMLASYLPTLKAIQSHKISETMKEA